MRHFVDDLSAINRPALAVFLDRAQGIYEYEPVYPAYATSLFRSSYCTSHYCGESEADRFRTSSRASTRSYKTPLPLKSLSTLPHRNQP
jgi:hypothetical protein